MLMDQGSLAFWHCILPTVFRLFEWSARAGYQLGYQSVGVFIVTGEIWPYAVANMSQSLLQCSPLAIVTPAPLDLSAGYVS